jgi:hypothetical protein
MRADPSLVAGSWKHLGMSDLEQAGRRRRPPIWVRRAGDVALSVGAAVLLAASGTVEGDTELFGGRIAKSTLLLIAGAVLFAIEGILAVRRSRRLAWLESEFPGLTERAALGERKLLELMRHELIELARHAHHFSNERISLYRVDADGFTLVARHSRFEGYQESLGQDHLPLDCGVIGAAWRDHSAAELGLPAAGQIQNPPHRQWEREQERRWGITPAVSRGYIMRSQSYAAFRLYTDDERARGVLVFESTTSTEDLDPIRGAGPILRAEELDPFVKSASTRLSTLLRFSHAISRQRTRELLEELQGPGRDRSA